MKDCEISVQNLFKSPAICKIYTLDFLLDICWIATNVPSLPCQCGMWEKEDRMNAEVQDNINKVRKYKNICIIVFILYLQVLFFLITRFLGCLN